MANPGASFLLRRNSLGLAGAEPQYRCRARSTEVCLNFSASDQNDHGVATLQPTDFVVVDKDIIVRNFQSFTRSGWTKLELAIVVDASESVTRQFRQEISDTLDLVSGTAGIPDDHVSIVSFRDSRPELRCAGSCRASRATETTPSVATLTDAVASAEVADVAIYGVNVDSGLPSHGTGVLHSIADASRAS